MEGYKFDLRIYILVTSCDPLRIFLYNDGLVRMGTEKYHAPSEANLVSMNNNGNSLYLCSSFYNSASQRLHLPTFVSLSWRKVLDSSLFLVPKCLGGNWKKGYLCIKPSLHGIMLQNDLNSNS